MCPNSRGKRKSETAREEEKTYWDSIRNRETESVSGENKHSCAAGTKQQFSIYNLSRSVTMSRTA